MGFGMSEYQIYIVGRIIIIMKDASREVCLSDTYGNDGFKSTQLHCWMNNYGYLSTAVNIQIIVLIFYIFYDILVGII